METHTWGYVFFITTPDSSPPALQRLFQRRPWAVAAALSVGFGLLYACLLPAGSWTTHSQYNHFGLLAEGWLAGRLHLPGAPPAYAHGNDFAWFQQRWYVTFPGFPALLLLPVVWLRGSALDTPDGLIFALLAGLGPGLVYLIGERLRQLGRSRQSQTQVLLWSLLFGAGSVYFFSSVQGSVWFAAHVVGVLLMGGFLLACLGGRAPLLAGLCLGCAFHTRTPLILAAGLGAWEIYQARKARGWGGRSGVASGLLVFGAPIAAALCVAAWLNKARFGVISDFGYSHLQIVWRHRIAKWGLFSFHYLPRNLGVVFGSLPYLNLAPSPTAALLRITQHGLPLWLTSPYYLLLLSPKQPRRWFVPLVLSAALVAMPTLLYQNTGQAQFGYRFSNDYALLLFAALMQDRRPWKAHWAVVGLWCTALNLFGALSFGRANYARWYTRAPGGRIFQPD